MIKRNLPFSKIKELIIYQRWKKLLVYKVLNTLLYTSSVQYLRKLIQNTNKYNNFTCLTTQKNKYLKILSMLKQS